MGVVDRLMRLYSDKGDSAYFGEALSETEHALQTARLAEASGAGNELIVAALLHDVGHLLHGLPEEIAERGIDGRHEEAGAAWLERHFGPVVAGPVRLHVAAKRYLCATDPGYRNGLSAASLRSLELQGGPLTPEEARRFEQVPHWMEAVALRRWDDGAKRVGLVVPGMEDYRNCLEAVLRVREIG